MKVSQKTARLFVSGDEEARSQVYTAYYRILYFLIASIVNNPQDAEDLLSETFLKTMEHAAALRDAKNLDSYLTKTALHLAFDFLAKKRQVVSYDSIEEVLGEDSHDNFYFQELNTSLSDRENLVVTLVVLYGYSLREVAPLLGISKSEVHLIYRRAIDKLRRFYSPRKEE